MTNTSKTTEEKQEQFNKDLAQTGLTVDVRISMLEGNNQMEIEDLLKGKPPQFIEGFEAGYNQAVKFANTRKDIIEEAYNEFQRQENEGNETPNTRIA